MFLSVFDTLTYIYKKNIYNIHTLHRRIIVQENMVQPVLFNHQTILQEWAEGDHINLQNLSVHYKSVTKQKWQTQWDDNSDEILSLQSCNYMASFRCGNSLVKSPPYSASFLNTKHHKHSFLLEEATFHIL